MRARRGGLALAAWALAACNAAPITATWELEMASPDLAARAARIEAEVRRGGCDSADAVYRAEFAPGPPAAKP